MKILLLSHSFNSMTQKIYVDLVARNHEVFVEFDINDAITTSAVSLIEPDLIIAPFLKRAIPETIWKNHRCLIIHPGPVGDRGPSALDWAVLKDKPKWGVTILQANEVWDGGDVWASRSFKMRPARKASLYRKEVTHAASEALLEAIEKIQMGQEKAIPLAEFDSATIGDWQEPLTQTLRAINWQQDTSEVILRKINSADGFPGLLTTIAGQNVYAFDAHLARNLSGTPQDIIAHKNGAVCLATLDGAIWIGHLRLASEEKTLKLPAAAVIAPFADSFDQLLITDNQTGYQDIWSKIEDDIGYLYFEFYNGAMSTHQCQRLLVEYKRLKSQNIKAIALMGGDDFWSNGIHLNQIEQAESPADESLANINAMDDLCLEIINTTDKMTFAVMRGNAGAGGVFLAMAADFVFASSNIVLNPHYKSMGNLYGSEYWTYLFPKKVGLQQAEKIMANRLPVSAQEALDLGMIDELIQLDLKPLLLAKLQLNEKHLITKQQVRERDEAEKPLVQYREEELSRMNLNFYGFDPSYHVARFHFVHKSAKSRTPPYLAPHRRVKRVRTQN